MIKSKIYDLIYSLLQRIKKPLSYQFIVFFASAPVFATDYLVFSPGSLLQLKTING